MESDSEFLDMMWGYMSDIRRKDDHYKRLFALARKGAEVEQRWPEGFSKIDWPMLDCCATEGCGFAPTIRMERGDVASFYCEPCASKIARLVQLAAGEPSSGLRPDRRTNVAERLFGDE